jgi:hypothetical protein
LVDCFFDYFCFFSGVIVANIIVCSGNLVPAKSGPTTISGVLSCDTGWQIVPYVEPTDSTAIYAQLVALNEFDPSLIALITTGVFVLFIMGFSAGMVLKRMRQA